MARERYFRIYEWMTEGMGLGGSDLLVFAVMNHFTNVLKFGQKGISLEETARLTGLSRRTVIRSVKELRRRGLVIPGKAVKYQAYTVNEEAVEKASGKDRMASNECQNVTEPEETAGQNVTCQVKKCHLAGDKMSPRRCQNVTPYKYEKYEEKEKKAPPLPPSQGAGGCTSPSGRDGDGGRLRRGFEELLEAYPGTRLPTDGKARERAWRIFRRHVSPDDIPGMMDYVSANAVESDNWTREGGRYCPVLETFLASERWKDGRYPIPKEAKDMRGWDDVLEEMQGKGATRI